MSITRSRLGRRLAAGVAGALALSGAVALAPAAHAEQTGQPVAGSGVATWGISDLLGTARAGFPSPAAAPYDAPATYDATSKLSTWGNGTGTVNADGSADLSFSGAAVLWATTGNAFAKLADLEAEWDADGDGQVTALVSYGSTTAGDWSTATVTRPAERVKVVDLYSTDPNLEEYPDALENVAYSFTSDADSYDWSGLTGRWSTEIQTFLAGTYTPIPAPNGCQTTSNCWAYASTVVNGAATTGSTTGVLRWPAPFAFSIDRAVAATETAASLEADGIEISVDGTGFAKTFPGVYVSLRELPEAATPYAGGAVEPDLATAWVSNLASDIGEGPQGASAVIGEDGSFSTSLRIAPEDVEALDASKSYTVVTRKAHGMGGIPQHAGQITETPVDLAAIITAAQARSLTTTNATAPAATVGQDAVVNVAVTPVGAGTVQGAVKLLDGGVQVDAADLVGGAATFTVEDLTVGTHTFDVVYEGGADFWASDDTVEVVVGKAVSTTGVAGSTSVGYRTTPTYEVTVSGGTPTGNVTFTGAGAAQTVALAGGKASFKLPAALPAGKRTLVFSYGGNATTEPSTKNLTVTIRKGTSSTAVTLVRAATTKVAGKFRVRVSSVQGGPAPAGKVTVVLTKGKIKRTLAARQLSNGVVVITLPKLASKGLWTLRASYSGGPNHGVSAKMRQFRVS